jgi:hypothetical protein
VLQTAALPLELFVRLFVTNLLTDFFFPHLPAGRQVIEFICYQTIYQLCKALLIKAESIPIAIGMHRLTMYSLAGYRITTLPTLQTIFAEREGIEPPNLL